MSDGFGRVALTGIAARLVPFAWPWAQAQAHFVAGNWERRVARRSGLFDGRVLLACGWRVDDGLCSIDLFETSYAAFIAHRDAGSPDLSVANAFAAIVPRASDGGVVLGIMGGHTANAGQVYFPCGTPDRGDVRGDSRVDLAGSAVRELAEETGMDLPDAACESWLLLRGEGQLGFLRPVTFPLDAETLRARMERHRAAEADPELAGFLVARGSGDIDPARMPGLVRAYLADLFSP